MKAMYSDSQLTQYDDIGNDSGVIAYHIEEDISIEVLFNIGKYNTYLYKRNVIGDNHFKKMCQFAMSGNGLNGFINSVVKKKYSERSLNNKPAS